MRRDIKRHGEIRRDSACRRVSDYRGNSKKYRYSVDWGNAAYVRSDNVVG
jgi:hypothetical protein